MLEWESKTKAESGEYKRIANRIQSVGRLLPSLCNNPVNERGYPYFIKNLWSKTFKAWEYPRMFLWLKKLQEAKRQTIKVMDFGCGFSPFPQFLAENGFEVWGVDNDSQGFIETVTLKNMQKVYPDVYYCIDDISSVNEKFDAIISCSVIEHIKPDERKKVYDEMKRLGDKSCHIVDYYFSHKPHRDKNRIDFVELVETFGFSYKASLCPGSSEFSFVGWCEQADFMFSGHQESRILVGDDIE